MNMTIESSVFGPRQPIPKRYTGEGEDVSPPLSWKNVPAGTKELALICDDPDAPVPEPWVHWVIYKFAPDVTSLPENVPPALTIKSPVSACQGRNSWSSGRTIGYRGPMPPPGHGTHHYRFRLYALHAELKVDAGIDKAALLAAIRGHVLAEVELVGTYER